MSDWAEKFVIGLGVAVLFGILYGMMDRSGGGYELTEEDETLQEKAKGEEE